MTGRAERVSLLWVNAVCGVPRLILWGTSQQGSLYCIPPQGGIVSATAALRKIETMCTNRIENEIYVYIYV